MYLQNYPMDTQKCFLSITSLANDDSRMTLKWIHERKKEERVDNLSDLYLANVHPLKYQVTNATTSKYQIEWPTGHMTAGKKLKRFRFTVSKSNQKLRLYTSLRANFTFDRHLSSHIFNVYIPSGLVVLLSFLSFWLNVRSVPARVALGLTSLLTLSTQASQVRSRLPPINYLTALDVWLFACILQVFLSLIQYATVYSCYSVKVRNQRSNSSNAWSAAGTRGNIASELSMAGHETRTGKRKREMSPKKPLGQDFDEDVQYLDKASRLIFPLGFLVFSIAYWASYLKRS
ncbi:Glycine receptor subunit beta-type 4 like protein [Argiope bruennichi]|uniref:Glycine receptor subunit beta-type 4 like protein n=1 Tax=Argiope bruennichi TaxID=94029 RepID=A0A8T0FRT8_ARGBR|nr:Glycine receptor subunit beta-type 4 like protein [Argiope bruennichi]